MTKSQLIELIAEKAPHVPPRRVEAIVNAVFECMTESLKAGERIELRGFGCFGVKSRPARIGRNPKTGGAVSLPRRVAVSFAAGKELRERLNREPPPPQRSPGEPERLPPVPVPRTSARASHSGAGGEVAPRI